MFAGSFGLEAAEAICSAKLDPLASFIDKSLLRQTGQGRFFMLATIREFSVDRLGDSQEWDAIRDTHAKHFRDFAEERRDASRYGDPSVLEELDLEHDNFEPGSNGRLLQMPTRSRYRFLPRSGCSGCSRVTGLRDTSLVATHHRRRSRDVDPAVRLRAWGAASELARFAGDAAWAQELKADVVKTARLAGNEKAVAITLCDLSQMTADQGEIARARELAEEAMAIQLRIGDDYAIARGRCAIAQIEFVVGNFVEARGIFEETNDTFERTNRFDLMENWLMESANVCAARVISSKPTRIFP